MMVPPTQAQDWKGSTNKMPKKHFDIECPECNSFCRVTEAADGSLSYKWHNAEDKTTPKDKDKSGASESVFDRLKEIFA